MSTKRNQNLAGNVACSSVNRQPRTGWKGCFGSSFYCGKPNKESMRYHFLK